MNKISKVLENQNRFKMACKIGYFEIVKYLVEVKGVNIHAYYSEGFLLACQDGHFEIVEYLVSKGVNIHVCKDAGFVLACQDGHFEIFEYLVEKGADIHVGNEIGFRYACQNGHFEIVKYLVAVARKDIDRDEYDRALLLACKKGHFEIAQILSEKTFLNIDALYYRYAYENSPFKIACRYGHIKIVKHFVIIHKRLYRRERERRKGSWRNYPRRTFNIDQDMRIFYEVGLKLAFKNNHLEISKYLFKECADIQMTQYQKEEFLELFCEYDCLEMVKHIFLVIKKEDIRIDNGFEIACKNGHLEIVKYFGSEHSETIRISSYAFRLACENRHLEIVKYLISILNIHEYINNNKYKTIIMEECFTNTDRINLIELLDNQRRLFKLEIIKIFSNGKLKLPLEIIDNCIKYIYI